MARVRLLPAEFSRVKVERDDTLLGMTPGAEKEDRETPAFCGETFQHSIFVSQTIERASERATVWLVADGVVVLAVGHLRPCMYFLFVLEICIENRIA